MSDPKPETVAHEQHEHREAHEPAVEEAARIVAVGMRSLEELAAVEPGGQAAGLAQLAGVPITVTIQLGRVRLTLGDLCRLEPGTLLELDREAHEPADVLVNGRVVARGEVAIIEGHYGVRITRIEP